MRTALKAMMVKEMRQIVRDKRIIVVLIAAPMIQLLVFGHAVELELRELQLAVLDQDQSPQSRAFVEGVCAGDAFSRGDSLQSHTQIEPEIRSGRAHAVLVIPPGWSASLQRGESTTLQLLIDGTDMNRATFAQNALMAYSNTISIARIQAALPASALATRQGSLRIDTRILFNPSLNSKHYFVPGIAGTLLLVVTMAIASMGLAREKETGTLEQVMVTPIAPAVIIIGKTLPYAIIGLLDLGLVVAGGMWVFGVPLRGSLALLGLGGILYIMSTLGLGVFLSTVAKSQQQAFMGAFFLILPATVLSGFMTPIESMPELLQTLTHFNPMRHFVALMRSVMLEGAQTADLLPELSALAGTGFTVMMSSTYLMWRRLR